MNIHEIREWRGWIWIAVFLFTTYIGASFSLYARAENHTNERIDQLREQLVGELADIRQDLRTIREDIKQLLRNR